VPGIGRKGAQRIVLELAGRLGSPGEDVAALGQAVVAAGGPAAARLAALTWRDQVRTGLVNLGWQPRDADQAIAAVEPDLLAAADGAAEAASVAVEVDVAVALRAALRVLGRA
jgi:holliday junction DNA helicase RuvA